MTQGKIERYHRSMKSILLLDHYYSPDDLKAQIAAFVEHYNNRRYHGRAAQIIERRKRIKRETIKKRRTAYWKAVAMPECVP